jgi:hypothetical protein
MLDLPQDDRHNSLVQLNDTARRIAMRYPFCRKIQIVFDMKSKTPSSAEDPPAFLIWSLKYQKAWIWPVAVQKLASIVLVFISFAFIDHYFGNPSSLDSKWTERLSAWDGRSYLHLAKDWYSPGDPACAFYPLFPFLIRIVSPILGGSFFASGLLLSNIFSVAWAFLFYRFVSAKHGETIALTSLTLLLTFPGAICFGLIYSESLFLFLVMLLFVGIHDRKLWLACLSGCLLSLTRPVGILLVLPFAWQLAETIWRVENNSCQTLEGDSAALPRSEGDVHVSCSAGNLSLNSNIIASKAHSIGRLSSVILSQMQTYVILAICLGFGMYLVLMYHATGNPFEAFRAEDAYPNTPSTANIIDASGLVRAFLNFRLVHGMQDSMIDRFIFVLFLVTLPAIWRLDRTYFFYALAVGMVPAMSSWFISYNRYVELCFPMFVVLAQAFQKPSARWLLWYYLLLLVITQAVFLFRSINFEWAV